MNRFFACLILLAMVAIHGCGNKNESSPYGDLLARPPYTSITDSIKQQPGHAELYFRRAVLLNRNDLPEPALVDFQKAWSLQKEEKYAFGISSILLEKKPDSAVIFLNDALKALPQSVLLRINLARVYDALGKTDEAYQLCVDILKDNPEQVDVLKMKAALLDKKGNINEAITTLERAYTLTPYDVELNYELAYKYAETKNRKVLQLCDSLAAKDSMHQHAEPDYYKGIYYANMNDKVKAISLFDQALQNDYNFLNAYIEKGRIYFDQKKYEEAYKTFNLAMTISPKFPDAYFWMGKSQEALGNKSEARLNYERAYGLDKTFTEAKESADRLK